MEETTPTSEIIGYIVTNEIDYNPQNTSLDLQIAMQRERLTRLLVLPGQDPTLTDSEKRYFRLVGLRNALGNSAPFLTSPNSIEAQLLRDNPDTPEHLRIPPKKRKITVYRTSNPKQILVF